MCVYIYIYIYIYIYMYIYIYIYIYQLDGPPACSGGGSVGRAGRRHVDGPRYVVYYLRYYYYY